MLIPVNFCCFIAILALASCNRVTPKPEDNQLGEKIMTVAKSTGAKQLSMDTVVKGEWDHVYILHPYTNGEHISSLRKEINGLRSIDANRAIHIDRSSHLIFTKEGDIVFHTRIPRYPCCDFIAAGKGPTSLKRSEAVFNINRSVEGKDFVYTLSPAR